MIQAAISLENARLYAQLADYTKTLERKVEAQTQALQQEIAERQQTEAALRQSEANYRNLLQTANSIIIRYDTRTDSTSTIMGWNSWAMKNMRLGPYLKPSFQKPNSLDAIWDPFHICFVILNRTRKARENLCRDGRRVWVAWSNQAILNEQGQ